MPNRGRRIAAKKALLGKTKKIKRPSTKVLINNISGGLSLTGTQHDYLLKDRATPKEKRARSTDENYDKSDKTLKPRILSEATLLTATAISSKSASRSSSHDTVYRYIRPELQRIGVCSSIVIGLLIVLSFILK
jgi:hypothetical protein